MKFEVGDWIWGWESELLVGDKRLQVLSVVCSEIRNEMVEIGSLGSDMNGNEKVEIGSLGSFMEARVEISG